MPLINPNDPNSSDLFESRPEIYPWPCLRVRILRLMDFVPYGDKLLVLELVRIELQHELIAERNGRRLFEKADIEGIVEEIPEQDGRKDDVSVSASFSPGSSTSSELSGDRTTWRPVSKSWLLEGKPMPDNPKWRAARITSDAREKGATDGEK